MRRDDQGTSEASPFDSLPSRIRRWIDFEQTVNDRLFNDKLLRPFDERSNTVSRRLYPEKRPTWPQELVWLPNGIVRSYGIVDEALKALDLPARANSTPLFLHAQVPAPHRRLADRYGREQIAGFCATPTASHRTVLAWATSGKRKPALLKLSIGAIIAHTRRALRENQVSRAVLISSLFETIPASARKRLGFDWFAEPCGMIETQSRHGWIFRRWPQSFGKDKSATLIPGFSVLSKDGTREPLLIRLARRSRKSPERFVLDTFFDPLVKILAYLLFEEGLQYESHPQNVLWEMDQNDNLTGRIVLRDLADSSVNIAFRMAREKVIPKFPPGFVTPGAPFPVAGNAVDYRTNAKRWRILRGYDTVEGYGLHNFLWVFNQTMSKFFPAYDSTRVERQYLEMWQQAAVDALRLRPLFRKNPKGIATDETIAYYLSQVDWTALGAASARLPNSAEALMIEGRMRRRRNARYDRLPCAWGDLYVCENRPGFFQPAF